MNKANAFRSGTKVRLKFPAYIRHVTGKYANAIGPVAVLTRRKTDISVAGGSLGIMGESHDLLNVTSKSRNHRSVMISGIEVLIQESPGPWFDII